MNYLISQILCFFVNFFDCSWDDSGIIFVVSTFHGEGFATAGLAVCKDAHVIPVDRALKVLQVILSWCHSISL